MLLILYLEFFSPKPQVLSSKVNRIARITLVIVLNEPRLTCKGCVLKKK